ncbi:DHHC palmitoyltransferase family [Rhizoctonia solani]|uniref:DHHC palmitoyltransferase family n=1 Tax=Rhizoctonia solani TaxID=456999 RepID=A0A8H7ILY6_9AGAM|nr:DHHC palmitoyltransferase family [Rhizoctonia solani]
MERAADTFTGVAGPFFVGFACLLMGSGVLVFFEVIAPDLPYPLITIPLCLLIAANLLAHYYYVCTTHPGNPSDGLGTAEGRGWSWAPKRRGGGVQWSPVSLTDPTGTRAVPRCNKCHGPKPECSPIVYPLVAFTHSVRRMQILYPQICSAVCLSERMLRTEYQFKGPSLSSRQIPQATIARYLTIDNCQWINQCVRIYLLIGSSVITYDPALQVGLRNERDFVLFMYVIFRDRDLLFVVAGYRKVWPALDFGMHSVGLAVSVMLAWNIYQIGKGVTTVEGYDHGIYSDRAQSRGEKFVNSFDLGFFKNLAYFFNVIPSGYPLWVLLLPLRTAPYTNGFVWARRQGYTKHGGLREGEEMTDDED